MLLRSGSEKGRTIFSLLLFNRGSLEPYHRLSALLDPAVDHLLGGHAAAAVAVPMRYHMQPMK